MSGTEPRVHRRLEALVDAANDFLPADVYLGYEITHTESDADASALPDAEVVRTDHEMKRRWRERLGRDAVRGVPGSADDLATLGNDAENAGGVDVLFELVHLPSGTRVIRTYSLMTLRNLVTRGDWTAEQKRQAVKNQLQGFYAELRARLPVS